MVGKAYSVLTIKFEPEGLAVLERIATALEAQKPKPAAPKAKKAGPDAPKEPPEYFEEFWNIWPKKVARPAAEKAWRALKPSRRLIGIIARDVQAKAVSMEWQKQNGQFIPYPATYLNGRRWEDEGVETGASIDDGKTVTPEGSGY